MAALTDIVSYLDAELRTAEIPDYPGALNGLQFANRGDVRHVAASVDFSARVVNAAVERGADLLILHHGMFWAGQAPIVERHFERLDSLLTNGVAVYSSHLPLDLHPRFGNNALLAHELGLSPSGGFATSQGVRIGVSGTTDIGTAELVDRTAAFCGRHHRHPRDDPNSNQPADSALGNLQRRRSVVGHAPRGRRARIGHDHRRRGPAPHGGSGRRP